MAAVPAQRTVEEARVVAAAAVAEVGVVVREVYCTLRAKYLPEADRFSLLVAPAEQVVAEAIALVVARVVVAAAAVAEAMAGISFACATQRRSPVRSQLQEARRELEARREPAVSLAQSALQEQQERSEP